MGKWGRMSGLPPMLSCTISFVPQIRIDNSLWHRASILEYDSDAEATTALDVDCVCNAADCCCKRSLHDGSYGYTRSGTWESARDLPTNS